MSVTDTDGVTITQYTDPMCTWCWGSVPVVRHLRATYGDQIGVEYVMGGLVEDFDSFYDAANDISKPSDVAPHWEEASERHGMPVDTSVFETDPAESTYPASIAFVAARQQDRRDGQRYLRALREAYTTQARNVSRRGEQVALAERVGLDVAAFERALEDGTAREQFETDLARTREAGVRAFPTYRVSGPEGERVAAGFQSYDQLQAALGEVAPELDRSAPPSVRAFVREFGPVATQEVAESCELDRGKARQVLQSLHGEGALRRDSRGNGVFWDGGDR
ncbi:DsbA family protein [Halomicroarcula sp. F28]|uniref:DsbA family oxidoreductase n=1 Tax=Haloarcula salinisoli TaxID=2487746 RepID=UPI001C733A01|nr:DsbA family protein [Halomicroarcula salinisoli]MBX0286850.1 DsbA family protein [Halomicroarcula salinisoli]